MNHGRKSFKPFINERDKPARENILKIKITNFLVKYLFKKKHEMKTAATATKAQNKIIISCIFLIKIY